MLAKVFSYRVRRWVLVIVACLAVMCGLVVARFFSLDEPAWLWLLVPFVVFSLRRQNPMTLLFIFVLCFGLGLWRGSEYAHKLAAHNSLHYQKVVLIGRATEDAVYGKRYQLEFSLSNVHVVEPTPMPLVGNVTARGFGESAIYRGDTVQVTGKLYPTLGNNLASVSFAKLQVLQRDMSWINNLRREFAAGMLSALPEPAASFGLGLLIGQRSTLPQQAEDQLRQVGLTHIIAVSGYNLRLLCCCAAACWPSGQNTKPPLPAWH